MTGTTRAIIEARMTSTRLPGKVLLPICGKPELELLVERLRQSRLLDGVVIATTVNATDDPLEQLAQRLGVGCFRGSEEDVLERVLLAAQASKTDVIVEVTGDCPLVDPEILDDLVARYRLGGHDYVSNTLVRSYPRGMDVQVFSTATLADVASRTSDPVDHEHVSLFIYEHPELYRLYNQVSDLPEPWWDLRLTLDTQEDYTLIRQIFEALYPVHREFRLADILALLERHPEWLGVNRHIQQKKVRG
ncbi:MAG: glycosyltransferase family protein [Magnetococcales bacterium]|nr:glycosyltransferase family protein [Magnetococcales bacterium]